MSIEGKTAVYAEDDWVARVEVVADNSDAEWLRYTLKVLKTLESSKRFIPVEDGTEFAAEHKKDRKYGYAWTLCPEKEGQ